jgi:hypothetical protein
MQFAMSARIKSGLWVAALLRRCSVEGMFGAVLHKGADEAGAVYVVINHLDNTCDFIGPAPGSAYDETGDRRFVRVMKEPCDWPTIREKIARLKKSDPDIWVVEIESRHNLAGLQVETD